MSIKDSYYNFVDDAQKLSDSGQYDEAEKILRENIVKIPAGWQPSGTKGEFDEIFFWNQFEFRNYANYARANGKKSCMWRFPSYSKAHFLLAYILAERGDFDEALDELDRGLSLEPDHPGLLCEKAYILDKFGAIEPALRLYRRAFASRPWNTVIQNTGALTGQAIALTNLNRLAEAEAAVRQAIEINPDSSELKKHLDYIRNLRSE